MAEQEAAPGFGVMRSVAYMLPSRFAAHARILGLREDLFGAALQKITAVGAEGPPVPIFK